MATEVDICNLALSHIGQSAVVTSIDPPDGTKEADDCETFYPIARDEFLERHFWRCATRRASLAALASNPSTIWSYAYSLPNLCLRPGIVLLPEATDDNYPQPYTIEVLDDGITPVLYTNVESAVLKFIVTQRDTTKFTPGLVLAVSYRLASYLAGTITKDLKQKTEMFKVSEAMLVQAAALDGNAEKTDTYKNHVPAHLRARQ